MIETVFALFMWGLVAIGIVYCIASIGLAIVDTAFHGTLHGRYTVALLLTIVLCWSFFSPQGHFTNCHLVRDGNDWTVYACPVSTPDEDDGTNY